MRHDPSIRPFDVQADEADDVTQQFWGSSRGWDSRQHPATDDRATPDHSDDLWNDDTAGSLKAIRDGLRAFRPQRISRADHSGQVERTRQHGTVTQRQASAPRRPAANEASLGELAGGWTDEDDFSDGSLFDGQPTQRFVALEADHELIPLSPVHPLADRIGLGAVDPLLVRIGMLIVVVLLLVPIALALQPSSDLALDNTLAAAVVPAVVSSDASETAAPEPLLPQIIEPSTVDMVVTVVTSVDEPAAVPTPSADAEPTVEVAATTPEREASTAPATVGDNAQAVPSSGGDAATVSATAERHVPACPTTYVAGAGDSWYRIADAAGVTPNALLDENRATVNTVIFPGDDICLPAGATMPTQPTTTTVEPTSTEAPASTAPATTAPATTQPPAPASASEVQQIIRDVWPDELEEKALQIAWRESNYIPTAFNGSCCYGIFQIYWSVHVSWLDEFGIYSSSDLLDARKNVTAAYALYQRAGGWGPWGG